MNSEILIDIILIVNGIASFGFVIYNYSNYYVRNKIYPISVKLAFYMGIGLGIYGLIDLILILLKMF